MLPNSSPAWHLLLLSHCFNFSGAQRKKGFWASNHQPCFLLFPKTKKILPTVPTNKASAFHYLFNVKNLMVTLKFSFDNYISQSWGSAKKPTAPKHHPLEIPIILLGPSGSTPLCQSKTLPCAPSHQSWSPSLSTICMYRCFPNCLQKCCLCFLAMH